MDRHTSWLVVDDQRTMLADLLETLAPHEWDTPSLCAGWTVRDVAAHLTLAATARPSEMVRDAVRARGSFDRMIHESAVERARQRSPGQLVADLRGIVGSRRLAPATFWRDPLLDVLVHGQDIAVPLGRPRRVPPEAGAAAATRVWQTGFPFHARRRLAGLRLTATDVDWSVGAGAPVEGTIGDLLLLLTGRTATTHRLAGAGAQRLAAADGRHDDPMRRTP